MNAIARILIAALLGLVVCIWSQQKRNRAEHDLRDACRMVGYKQVVLEEGMLVICDHNHWFLVASGVDASVYASVFKGNDRPCLVRDAESYWVPIEAHVITEQKVEEDIYDGKKIKLRKIVL